MPQSKGVKREQARLRKRKQRDKESVTSDGVTQQRGIEMVPAMYTSYRGELLELLPARSRYLTLSDGQMLDRTMINRGFTLDEFREATRN